MSREIKFRAWEVAKNNWMKMDDGETYYIPLPRLMKDGSVIIEQYTGLKDKNGKEIYEGDIIEDTRGNIWECLWSETSSGWAFRRKFMSEDDFMASDDISDDWLERSKIVGNIHENPELLTPTL